MEQIYNCDEVAIFLNRPSDKVHVPVKTKHCHTLARGINDRIYVFGYSASDSGFVDRDMYVELFQKCFLPNANCFAVVFASATFHLL